MPGAFGGSTRSSFCTGPADASGEERVTASIVVSNKEREGTILILLLRVQNRGEKIDLKPGGRAKGG